MLIPFPIAFLVGAFVADFVFARTGESFWAAAAFYLLGAGIVMALLAAVFGFIDYFGSPRIRDISHAWQMKSYIARGVREGHVQFASLRSWRLMSAFDPKQILAFC